MNEYVLFGMRSRAMQVLWILEERWGWTMSWSEPRPSDGDAQPIRQDLLVVGGGDQLGHDAPGRWPRGLHRALGHCRTHIRCVLCAVNDRSTPFVDKHGTRSSCRKSTAWRAKDSLRWGSPPPATKTPSRTG
jgi:hypothetical protein